MPQGRVGSFLLTKSKDKDMSDIHILWARDAEMAQARFQQISNGADVHVLRRGFFDLVSAEDLDKTRSLTSTNKSYCIIFQIKS